MGVARAAVSAARMMSIVACPELPIPQAARLALVDVAALVLLLGLLLPIQVAAEVGQLGFVLDRFMSCHDTYHRVMLAVLLAGLALLLTPSAKAVLGRGHRAAPRR
jgi:hypothetical protein